MRRWIGICKVVRLGFASLTSCSRIGVLPRRRVGIWAYRRIGIWACRRIGLWACRRIGFWAGRRIGFWAAFFWNDFKGRKGRILWQLPVAVGFCPSGVP